VALRPKDIPPKMWAMLEEQGLEVRKTAPPSLATSLQFWEGMSERQFQKNFVAFAQSLGWRAVHFPAVAVNRGGKPRHLTVFEGDGKGFLDTELVRDRIIKVELKSDTGRLRPEQEAWMEAYRKAGVECYLWRPRDAEEFTRVLELPNELSGHGRDVPGSDPGPARRGGAAGRAKARDRGRGGPE